MILPKIYVGPMSKQLVDVVLENDFDVGFIPSRRQIEFSGGYVNNWTTKEFYEYVNGKKIIERDHGGPNQGLYNDDGQNSFDVDSKYFNIIHIDVWKTCYNIHDAAKETAKYIKILHSKNHKLLFEIGTEQSIRPYTHKELDLFLEDLKSLLSPIEFSKIVYVVIQCGTKLSKNHNIGVFDFQKLSDMIFVCKKYGIMSKEHNGDYISNDLRKEKLSLGLNAINIAPEFGVVQTRVLLDNMNEIEFETFYSICYASNKWKKWVSLDFDPIKMKRELVTICGHYNFSNELILPFVAKNENLIKNTLKLLLMDMLMD